MRQTSTNTLFIIIIIIIIITIIIFNGQNTLNAELQVGDNPHNLDFASLSFRPRHIA